MGPRSKQNQLRLRQFDPHPPSVSRTSSSRNRTVETGVPRRGRSLLLSFVILIVMVDIAAALLSSRDLAGTTTSSHVPVSGFGLVPSQVQRRSNNRSGQRQAPRPNRVAVPGGASLMPSQVLLRSHPDKPIHTKTSKTKPSNSPPKQTNTPPSSSQSSSSNTNSESGLDISITRSNPNQKRRRRKKKPPSGTSEDGSGAPQEHTPLLPKRPPRTGNLPDVFWRTIPMDDLRFHPNFEGLPPPSSIQEMDSLEDIRNFRQESWQWDAVHEGRCTTSQAVAALGFLDPEAGRVLGVPKVWQRGAQGAYHRLQRPALRTLNEMNAILCGPSPHNPVSYREEEKEEEENKGDLWTRQEDTNKGRKFPFAAKYNRPITEEDVKERKKKSQSYSSSSGFDFSVRMMWGNAQESTSLLTALNYFWEIDKDVVVKEIGMCGAGLKVNTTGEISNLLLGATPDGLIVYPNGTIEALEVKNHCPFFVNRVPVRKGVPAKRRKGKRFTIRGFNFDEVGVPPHYIPQLMMEMLCVGPECQSAVMIRQTATSGAMVLRLRRDDAWIDEMQYWLHRFQKDFVEAGVPPQADFFLKGSNEEDRERYMQFLEWTNEIKSRVEVVDHIPHSKIQRARAERSGLGTLFLD